jgi:hypothetical protein
VSKIRTAKKQRMKFMAKIFKLSGALCFFIAILGGILGQFDYVLVIKGAELPQVDLPTAMILAAVGAFLFATGWLMEKKYGNIDHDDRAKPVLDSNDLGFITSALKRTRKRSLLMAIFLGVFGIGIMAVLFVEKESTGVVIFIIILGLLCLAIAGFGLKQYGRLINIEQSEIYKLLVYTPQQVTGLDIQVITSGVGKIGTATNATIKVDKKNAGILQISTHDMELLKQHLQKHNPDLVINQVVQQA